MPEYIEREAMRRVLESASINTRFADEPPAANVAPVVHGRWIEHQDEYENWCECSVCGKSPDSPLDETPFCPNCGAKMDLEV